MEAPVFRRGVEMPRPSRGHEPNFLSHTNSPPLYLLATIAEVLDDLFDADLIDHAQTFTGDPELHKAFLILQPESLGMKIRQEPPARPILSVGHIVPGHRAYPGYLADSGHRYGERLEGRRPGTIPPDTSYIQPRSASET